MAEATWKDINGKEIDYKIRGSIVVKSLVIADPEIGVTIKPINPDDVPKGRWVIPPDNPDFFFVCTSATLEIDSDIFKHWVKILSQNKKSFSEEDIVSGYTPHGQCPFSS